MKRIVAKIHCSQSRHLEKSIMEKFQIIATIGPASRKVPVVHELIQAGMTMARLSCAHDSHSAHTRTIELVRTASKQLSRSIPILQDLQGPKLRVGNVQVKLSSGQLVTLLPEEQLPDCQGKDVYIPLMTTIHQHVKTGDMILINNGIVKLEVKEVTGFSTLCEVKRGGMVRPKKGVNLPTTNILTEAVTQKDKEDLIFGLGHNVEWVAVSFVKRARDITDLREWIVKHNPERMPLLMSKIETKESIENLEEIIDVSDAVMLARGDLALEVSFEKLPYLQKRVISACLSASKPVVVATGLMDSMCHRCVPTRAEVMDVANSVLDGATGLLLSQETAVGRYPVETMKMVSFIVTEVSRSFQK